MADEDPKTPLLFEPELDDDDGDEDDEQDFREALRLAVTTGRIMAACPCGVTLTADRYLELRCEDCGAIDHEAIVFTVPN